MAEVADDESPERERFLAGFGAFQSILDHKHLVEAEEDPRQVGDEEHEDNAHEDDGKVVLLSPPGNKTIKLFSLSLMVPNMKQRLSHNSKHLMS